MTDKLIFSNNIRKLRTQVRSMSVEQLEEFAQKLQQIIAERHDEEKQAKQAVMEHNQKVEKYLSMLQSEGIDVTDLLDKASNLPAFKKARKTRAKRPAKYQYTDENGKTMSWTGQGRMPKAIRLAIENDKKSLDDFLI